MSVLKISRLSFTLSVMCFGLLHFTLDNYMANKPADPFTAVTLVGFLFNILLVVCAFAMIVSDRPRMSATALGLLLLLWACIRHVPLLMLNLNDPEEWNSTSMAMAMAGASFLWADSFTEVTSKHNNFFQLITSTTSRAAGLLYGIPMLIFGMQHLLYADFVASLIPSWIPESLYWAYGAGAVLIASGCFIILRTKIKWTAILLGTMFLSWSILVHLPRIIAHPLDGYEWTSFLQAWALGASAFILSESFRRKDHRRLPGIIKLENIQVDGIVSKLKKDNANRIPKIISPARRNVKVQ